jgi:pyruvate formate lyase activating enzyme
VSRTSGIVFDIQHYAVHDGPGIRTLVFLKGCPLGCVWCCNPESQAHRPELRRIPSRCQACLRCAGVCPAGAVEQKDGAVRFDRATCARCDSLACVDACCSQALSVAGERMDADAVVARVAADREFYDNSGGGVTFSGGEPFAQPDFLTGLLEGCRSLGIRTAVETCGHVETRALVGAEPLVDLFLFDLKLAEGGRHRLLTGVDNRRILDNLAALASVGPAKIALRVPLIPGFTDDRPNLLGIAAIARAHGVANVHLQPYHPLGIDKYEQFGLPAPPAVPQLLPETIDRALAIFSEAGLRVELA